MILYHYICAHCGIDFTDNERVRKYCSRQCHNDARREMLTCARCNKQFQSPKHYRKNSATHYCSQFCATGNAGNGPTILTFVCEQCGTWYSRKLGFISLHNGRRFCSRQCTNAWNKANTPTGAAHPHYDSIQMPCAACGKTIERERHRLRYYKEQFCNTACMGKWQSENRAGPNSNSWKGGRIYYYGPNFQSQAKIARKRDRCRCQRCGIAQAKLGKKLDVHHIIPFRTFGYIKLKNDNYKKANELSNLISLCSDCHKLVEHGNASVQLPLIAMP